MDEKQKLEFTGEDVEAAIAAGLQELGVTPADVLVEVLEEPSRGVFGIGAKPARVSLKLIRTAPPPSSTPVQPVKKRLNKPEPKPRRAQREDVYDDYSDDEFIDDYGEEVEPGEDGAIAIEVLEQLLAHMGIQGRVSVRRAQSQNNDSDESHPWLLDINGPDMSLLIGRRGETLNSLQYITRLITSRKLQRRANIVVDAGGYKSRRSNRLRELAVRMADKAVDEGRTVSLEPMPPNERRIIHLELRNRRDVDTRSTGEGETRKVMIVPKR